MIAVGVGVAPMIQTLRGIFKAMDRQESSGAGPVVENQVSGGDEDEPTQCSIKRIVLLYGVVSI